MELADLAGELERLALVLEREVLHWQAHPDYFSVRREAFPEGTSYADARAEIAGKMILHRGTHTDIVMRDVMWRLRRITKELAEGVAP